MIIISGWAVLSHMHGWCVCSLFVAWKCYIWRWTRWKTCSVWFSIAAGSRTDITFALVKVGDHDDRFDVFPSTRPLHTSYTIHSAYGASSVWTLRTNTRHWCVFDIMMAFRNVVAYYVWLILFYFFRVSCVALYRQPDDRMLSNFVPTTIAQQSDIQNEIKMICARFRLITIQRVSLSKIEIKMK